MFPHSRGFLEFVAKRKYLLTFVNVSSLISIAEAMMPARLDVKGFSLDNIVGCEWAAAADLDIAAWRIEEREALAGLLVKFTTADVSVVSDAEGVALVHASDGDSDPTLEWMSELADGMSRARKVQLPGTYLVDLQ